MEASEDEPARAGGGAARLREAVHPGGGGGTISTTAQSTSALIDLAPAPAPVGGAGASRHAQDVGGASKITGTTAAQDPPPLSPNGQDSSPRDVPSAASTPAAAAGAANVPATQTQLGSASFLENDAISEAKGTDDCSATVLDDCSDADAVLPDCSDADAVPNASSAATSEAMQRQKPVLSSRVNGPFRTDGLSALLDDSVWSSTEAADASPKKPAIFRVITAPMMAAPAQHMWSLPPSNRMEVNHLEEFEKLNKSLVTMASGLEKLFTVFGLTVTTREENEEAATVEEKKANEEKISAKEQFIAFLLSVPSRDRIMRSVRKRNEKNEE